MTRRLLLAACALAAVSTLASCATFDAGHVAEVNGAKLDDEELEAMIDNQFVRDELATSIEGGVAIGNDARGLVQAWVALTAIDQAGLLDDATKETARTELTEQYAETWDAASPELQEMLITDRATSTLGNAGALDRNDIAAAIAAADVDISSRIGYWNPETQTVDPLGAPSGRA